MTVPQSKMKNSRKRTSDFVSCFFGVFCVRAIIFSGLIIFVIFFNDIVKLGGQETKVPVGVA